MFVEVKNSDEYRKYMAQCQRVVVDFSATRCGPCKTMYSLLQRLASSPAYQHICFIKVDVEKCQSISQNIRSLPTVIFRKGPSVIGEVKGMDESKINYYLQALAQ